ncbi:23S rRNA Um-2552 2'-O-methyltransferase [Sulfuritortus calidifontis]|uniref:Ribosomal RNA large subunit methyltransferase E n=1 Tax=Sulfuritortus calidifontis TaxID=1914471 RepID=A0A4R3JXI0_9PROT|nr:RlmE family RNA methyltransferase [Sulfuritortus calidifontis]TCS71376.1 23S rRNA Um-2552 2'-O-methyltransferase [Sulfuritortus calidifontis]
MKRSSKTRAWHHRHVHDFYVREAQAQGYRSRAAFKLMEIDDRDRLFRPGLTVVDLGAAPGGWCQVAAERMKGQGRIVGLDLLEVAPIDGVDFIQGDFTEEAILRQLEAALAGRPVDLVICDMAPNITGIDAADQAKSYYLAELALDFAATWLQPKGVFLVKVFQGAGFEAYMKAMRARFRSVAARKPKASRERSREVYLLGREVIEAA